MNKTEYTKLKQGLQASYDQLDNVKEVLDKTNDSIALFVLLFKQRIWGI